MFIKKLTGFIEDWSELQLDPVCISMFPATVAMATELQELLVSFQ